jgi:hypothetical protein
VRQIRIVTLNLIQGPVGSSSTIRAGDSWMLNQVQHDGDTDLQHSALTHVHHDFAEILPTHQPLERD